MKNRVFSLALALAIGIVAGRPGAAQEQFPYQIFERYIEPLVQQIGMPGLSAVIIQDGRIAWNKNYGYADVEKKIPAEIFTPYPVCGITQALTGVLIGVCIDLFHFQVAQDIRTFVPSLPVTETTPPQVLYHSPHALLPRAPATDTCPHVRSPDGGRDGAGTFEAASETTCRGRARIWGESGAWYTWLLPRRLWAWVAASGASTASRRRWRR